AALARHVLSPGGDLRRGRDQLRALQRGGAERDAVPVRRRRHRDLHRPARARRVRLARLPAGRRARPAVRLPRRRAARPRAGPAVQPGEAPHRPLRQGDRRQPRVHLRLGRVAVRVPVRRPGRGQRGRLRGPPAQGRRHQPVLRLARRPAAAHALPRDRDLRGPRQGPDHPAPRGPRADAGDLLRRRAPGGDRAPAAAGRHGHRAHAGAPVRARRRARAARSAQLLGLQHDRLLLAALRLRLGGHHRQPRARRARAGVQGDGARPARRGHRGDPRRRLQPHRRGQPPGPDAVHARHRQPVVLPPRRGRAAVLHGLHRHRELAQRPAAAHPAADHGLAALLGHRDARRRLPVRPRVDAGPRVLRRRPPVHVLRPRPAGPGDLAGQAHRGAVGRRPGRLPGGQLPARLDRVERQVPRHRARLLARHPGHDGRVRREAHRVVGPLPGRRPAALRLDQLRHRARRVHAQRPRLVQREAQRGQRRGRPGRRRRQQLLEPRRRGPHRRRRGARAAPPPAAQLPHHPVPLPGRADAAARRRDGPHPVRQQQRLLPGLGDLLDGVVAREGRLRSHGLHVLAVGAPRLPPGVPSPPLLQRPPDPPGPR
ncbi:MAG: GH13_11 / GH13 / GH13_10 / GH13_13 / CBM 48 / GH13_37, partial [uncultured Nocardioides sp.]